MYFKKFVKLHQTLHEGGRYTAKKKILHTHWIINVVEPMEIHFKSPLKKKAKKINGAEFKIFSFNFHCNSI
jgi:hypothetical protein